MRVLLLMVQVVKDSIEPARDRPTKTALIVGAGQGIGLEFVRQLLQGNRVDRLYATYRNPQTDLLTIEDARLRCLPMDLTDEGQIAAVVNDMQTETATLHLVINCVGVLARRHYATRKEFAAAQY